MSYNMSYGIVFTGTNMAAPATESVTMGLMNVKYGAEEAGKGFDMLNWRSLMAFRGMVFGLQMGIFYISMLISREMMAESALLGLEGAQERYNETVREYGRGSAQATDALRALERAQIGYNRQSIVSNILMVSMGLQVVSMGISFLQAIPAIKTMITTLQSYNIVAGIAHALSGPAGWAKLGVGLAVGAGATYAITQMMNAPQTKVDVSVTDEDIIRQYMRRTGGTSIKSSGG